MTKLISLSFLFSLITFTSFSQTDKSFQKQCRISTGFGFASVTQNAKSSGSDIWLQLDYRLNENISLATEFENMSYKQPGYYKDLTIDPNEIKVYDNNFSFLVKYHFLNSRKFNLSFASGWTFCVRQNEYYAYGNNGTSQFLFPNVNSFSDYRIPLLTEVAYSVSDKINLTLRMKYNFNSQNGSTYSSGLGFSIRL